tara:strand:+ start:447 stop:1319 length:873 start_codon:yes stop_codon:yes gene_type:complete
VEKNKNQPFAIVVNKQAKNAKNIDQFTPIFNENQLQYDLYEVDPAKLEQTLHQILNHYSLVLVGGGDGTIRTAAQIYHNQPIILGILPLGTMNHFAKEAELPLTAENLVKAIQSPQTIQIDLAKVNQQIFINNSAIGFYPSFAKKRDYYHRFYNKWFSYVLSFFSMLSYVKRFSIHVFNEDIEFSLNTSFLMISNNLYTYQFPHTIKRISFLNAQLGIYCLKNSHFGWLKFLYYLCKRPQNFKILKTKKSLTVEVAHKNSILISLDGDVLNENLPLVYSTLPKALTLLKG